VRSLLDEDVVSGEKRFVWDGKNENGEEVSSGVYFAAVETEAGTLRTKLVLVR
jgi:flagellar hook assembly protein FlgD